MFTGIVEEMGEIVKINKGLKSSRLSIKGNLIFEDMKLGDSISVNGVCLTVTSYKNKIFTADVMEETLNRSSLESLNLGSNVNLERAMSVNGRFGGHIVSGHIDGTGKIISINHVDNAIWFKVNCSEKLMKYIIEKGSVTIDGISLTVAKVENRNFSVSIIPHTSVNTTLLSKRVGDIVNIENDCIGKYVEKLLNSKSKESNITEEFLYKNGF